MDPYNEMLKGYNTDLHDDEIAQMTDKILYEGLRENCNEEVYRFLFGCIDLTSLNPTDNQNQIAAFTRQVNELDNQNPELNHVAAICVYPNFVECVRMNLEVSDVNIAAVAGGFPSAQTFTEVKIAEAALAVAGGANEIDIVMNVGQFLSGEYEDICDEIPRWLTQKGYTKDDGSFFREHLWFLKNGYNAFVYDLGVMCGTELTDENFPQFFEKLKL